jgi:hypothetical protein
MYDYTWRSLWTWGVAYIRDELIPEHSARFFRAWTLFDPENPEPFYFLSATYALQGLDKKALKTLEKSVNKGFSNARRIEDAESFQHLHENTKYMDLLARVKARESGENNTE